MGMLLPSTNPWGPQDCTRRDCVTCNQNDEKKIDCRKRNILYESECVLCREVKKAGEGKEGQNMKDGKGIYMWGSHPDQYMRGPENMWQTERKNRKTATKSDTG